MSPPNYDRVVASLIPGYTSLARLSVSLLAASPLARQPGARVLVAGCGSGAELLGARALRPDWRLTALDPSGAMLALAQRKLQALHATEPLAIEWVQGAVEDLPPGEPAFDGALAVLVLQGLPDDGGKLRFLASLARALRPGAQAVLIDQSQPERNGLEDQLIAARQLFQRAESDEASSRASLDALGEVHPIGFARLTSLLEATGFSDPIPVFRALDYEGFLVQRLS